MSGSPSVLWYFVGADGKWRRHEGSRSLIARKKATEEGRVRSFSPDECKALGVDFPSEWSEEGGAKAESSRATKASRGLDALDLPPEPTPIELEPERVEPPPPAEVAPDPSPAAEPVEVAPPVVPSTPDDPEGSPATPADPASVGSALAALPPSVLTSLLATACTRIWCGGVLVASTPRGCKPIPLSESEVREIDNAIRMVLDRYLPALPTDHPELFALLLATALPIFDRRVIRADQHERIEPPADDDEEDEDDAPAPVPTRPVRPSNPFVT